MRLPPDRHRTLATSSTLGEASGFAYLVRKSGDVEISHHGRQATLLRGRAASMFVAQVSTCAEDEKQQLMARVTGNYKRGNERLARLHPRRIT